MNQESARTCRALIVDDHPIIADALSNALLSLRVFEGVDEESSIEAASARLQNAGDYDLVILDLHLTDTQGLGAMLVMRERFPEVPVVIFSADDSSATVTAAFDHRVQGFIPKSSPMQVVINAIRIVLSGGNYIPPQAIRMLGFEPRPPATTHQIDVAPLPILTPRQRQVMHYLLQGLPNKVIGGRLNMADGTVKSHTGNIYAAYGVGNRAQLILRARDLGLI